MPLTDAKVRALKGRARPYKAFDGEGLYVMVTPKGSRLWRLAYRYGGKPKTLALGSYPAGSLLDARKLRDEAKRRLRDGEDPAQAKRAAKVAAKQANGHTFEAVAREWFADQEPTWVPSYASRVKARMEEDLIAALGSRPIAQIEPFEVLDTIRRIEKRGAIEMAKRINQMAGAIFRHGVATARCSRDPSRDIVDGLKPSKPPKNRSAMREDELPDFLAKLRQYDGDAKTRYALRLVLLTFVRTSEARFAEWREFEELDGKEPLWRIPPERMKMRRPHLVPLSPQAVAVLKDLKRMTGNAVHLFPSNTKSGVFSENTLIYAMYRMGYHSKATVHGFRATASTILNEHEFDGDHIEKQLAHVDDSVRGVYNAADWLSQRRKMMCWWADFLDEKAAKSIS